MTSAQETILVVNDQPNNLQGLLSVLRSNRFLIRVADSSRLALATIDTEPPDLILMDIMMSDINGLETCARVKANKKTADIPIIFMTELDGIDDKIAAFAAGGVDYITKPFHHVEILARINTHLKLRKREKELLEKQLELQQQKQILEQLSITDSLTGLCNRRYLNCVINREFQSCKRYNTDLSCLMLDLDHFKRINDINGHDFGDHVLCRFSAIMSSSIRASDLIFRYGGEEFIILLPQTSIEGAREAGEKIRLAAEAEEVINRESGHQVHLTVSIGTVSLMAHKPNSPCELISFADKAMYRAKLLGRNRQESI